MWYQGTHTNPVGQVHRLCVLEHNPIADRLAAAQPEWDDQALFELLLLEGAQAGLAWITVLRKREGYRALFDNFSMPRRPVARRLQATSARLRLQKVRRAEEGPKAKQGAAKHSLRAGEGCGLGEHAARWVGGGVGASLCGSSRRSVPESAEKCIFSFGSRPLAG